MQLAFAGYLAFLWVSLRREQRAAVLKATA
jgi:hypothetical protein